MLLVVGALGCITVGLVVVGSPGTAARTEEPAATAPSLSTEVALPALMPETGATPVDGTAGNHSVIADVQQPATGLTPSAAGATADPTPTALTSAPPLKPDEVFGVVPSWDLSGAGHLNLDGLTTIDYFSLNINPDGSIENSGDAWSGYLSQNFLDLINRAHAAGDRVVLSVSDFSQSSLDQLATSATAPGTLAQSLLFLVKARDLDGVNLDFEGQGAGDRAGITNLVKAVSTTLRSANARYQITMDTYSSSALDPTGFYDLAGLSPFVDAFLVMAYQLNVASAPSASSSMTSAAASIQTTLNNYVLTVPAGKVILSLPLFGYDWPTSSGNLDAHPVGSPTVMTDSQEAATGHPVYWDSVTDTAWTSYQVDQQWHEAFFQNPDSLYLISDMARNQGVAGVGAWALGMDGSNDSAMISALAGNAPAQPDLLAGPPTNASGGSLVDPLGSGTKTHRRNAGETTTTQATTTTTTSTTSPAPAAGAPGTYSYYGNWLGTKTAVVPATAPSGVRTVVGVMSGFKTNDPGLSCLNHGDLLYVVTVAGSPNEDYAIADPSTGDCIAGAFVWDSASVAAPG